MSTSRRGRPRRPDTTTAPMMRTVRYRRQNDLDSGGSSFSSLKGSSCVRSTGSSTVVAALLIGAVQPIDFTMSRSPAVSPLGVPCKTGINTSSERFGPMDRPFSVTAQRGPDPRQWRGCKLPKAHLAPGDIRATPPRTPVSRRRCSFGTLIHKIGTARGEGSPLIRCRPVDFGPVPSRTGQLCASSRTDWAHNPCPRVWQSEEEGAPRRSPSWAWAGHAVSNHLQAVRCGDAPPCWRVAPRTIPPRPVAL